MNAKAKCRHRQLSRVAIQFIIQTRMLLRMKGGAVNNFVRRKGINLERYKSGLCGQIKTHGHLLGLMRLTVNSLWPFSWGYLNTYTVVGVFRFRKTPKQVILESICRPCLGNFSGYLPHISRQSFQGWHGNVHALQLERSYVSLFVSGEL